MQDRTGCLFNADLNGCVNGDDKENCKENYKGNGIVLFQRWLPGASSNRLPISMLNIFTMYIDKEDHKKNGKEDGKENDKEDGIENDK